MRWVSRLAFAVLVLTACGGGRSAPPARTATDPPTLAAAIASGQARHQPVIAEFGAAWCAPCRVFAEQVLTDPRVTAALRDVTFVQYDLETPVGKAAAARCQVTAIPALVGVAPDGSLRPLMAGAAPTVDQLLAVIAAAHAELGK